jgi:hypothetical protein
MTNEGPDLGAQENAFPCRVEVLIFSSKKILQERQLTWQRQIKLTTKSPRAASFTHINERKHFPFLSYGISSTSLPPRGSRFASEEIDVTTGLS